MKIKKKLLLILILSAFNLNNVKAKSISSLTQELEKHKAELKENKEKQNLTESQMSNISGNIKNIQSTITENYKTIDKLNAEIDELNKDIKNKEEEIKKIINFAQVSNGKSVYLEYAFGAEDFTDFIYRSAVAEQLANYNDKLIKEFNQKITDNKNKTDKLAKQKIELDKKQQQLQSEYSNLGNRLGDLTTEKVGIEDAIKQQEQLIKNYRQMGCYETEEISSCMNRLNSLPPDTQFWRPLKSGKISSRFGFRTLNASKDNHQGLDMATPVGTPVYSIANGVVISTYEVGGTGKAIYIKHTVNGKKYTSIYMHLSRYNVKAGKTVSKDTIIGYSGCTGQCYGAHLHLGLLTGHAGEDYRMWQNPKFYQHFIDPASAINFPSGYKSFNSRTTYYR